MEFEPFKNLNETDVLLLKFKNNIPEAGNVFPKRDLPTKNVLEQYFRSILFIQNLYSNSIKSIQNI